MTVKELILKLSTFDENLQVMDFTWDAIEEVKLSIKSDYEGNETPFVEVR